MSQENVEVVRRGFEALDREGVAGLFGVIDEVADPEVEVRAVGRLPDVGNVVRGPDAVKTWLAGLFGPFEIHVEADEFIDAGDAVVVVFRQFVGGGGAVRS
jgi:ketosteroid isomerase-like protein